jgi:hypothetical protein
MDTLTTAIEQKAKDELVRERAAQIEAREKAEAEARAKEEAERWIAAAPQREASRKKLVGLEEELRRIESAAKEDT